jgi:type II secretory pathway pseudopilin PulG
MAGMLRRFLRRRFRSASRGATFIEVTIAVVVLGMLLASVPPAMMAVSRSQFYQTEMRVAESISQSQFEYIKSQDYDTWSVGHWPSYKSVRLEGPLESYAVATTAYPVDPETGKRLQGGNLADYGVQEIEIVVYGWRYRQGGDEELLRTTNYKVDRNLVISGYEVTDLNPE